MIVGRDAVKITVLTQSHAHTNSSPAAYRTQCEVDNMNTNVKKHIRAQTVV